MFETFHMLRQGGWPMIPLALCSFIALTIIIERALALRRSRVLETPIEKALSGFESTADVAPLIAACERTGGPLARIVADAARTRGLPYQQALEKMHASGRLVLGQLERGLTLLEIVASISPLIGLLGTVLGMLTVFDAITREGLGDPALLADGIAKALVTTIAGLCVGIPALGFHSFYMKRVDQLASEMQDLTTTFIVKLQTSGDGGSPQG
ncbi:MAG: MotA/TolQ/ExbB proton channel family protein [Candidatus Hydrogenedentota bacterium]